MQWRVIVLFVLAVGCIQSHCAAKVRESKKDTLFYISFLNLVERGLKTNSGNFSKDYDLAPEQEVMNQVIRKLLGENFILLKVPDSCVASAKNDTLLRRDEKFIQRICEKYHMRKSVVILDVIWSYLSSGSMWGLQLKRASSPSYWIIGTWWGINASVYSPSDQKYIFSVNKRYTQWNDRKPVKWWPGVSHKRFFERPIKEVKKRLSELD